MMLETKLAQKANMFKLGCCIPHIQNFRTTCLVYSVLQK